MTIINEHMQIERLKAGNVSAFKVLYDLYAQRLYSFVYARAGTRVDAEDIVQDVFVSLWQNRQMIKNTDSLKPFLFTISRNMLISACRKRANMPVIEDVKTKATLDYATNKIKVNSTTKNDPSTAWQRGELKFDEEPLAPQVTLTRS